jgi:hypothetical protein
MTIRSAIALDQKTLNGAFDRAGWFLVEVKDIKYREPIGFLNPEPDRFPAGAKGRKGTQ